MTDVVRVAHIITSLDTGGAQTMLHKILSHIDREAFRSLVVSLAPRGSMTRAFETVSDRVDSLDMNPRIRDVVKAARLRRLLREWRPDVVQTWMYHANLIGGLAARMSIGAPVIWNVRASGYDRSLQNVQVINPAVRLGALASRFVPERIVYCSERAVAFHRELGYAASHVEVIPNGFDLQAFHPDPEARRSVRQELRVPDETLLVGLVARLHPMKNHALFLTAARAIADAGSDTHFVLCGDGVTDLRDLVDRHGLAGRCHLLGPRTDMPRITAALDVACSSSFGEGFPNTLGEAMASGVPCVATDVGDSAYLIGETGIVVPRDDAAAFAKACLQLLGDFELRARCGEAARRRVEEHFEIAHITRRYERMYRETMQRCAD